MALRKFIIERDIPAVGSLEREQLRGAAAQSNKVLQSLGPDIQWVESYVAADKTFCVYLAKVEAILRRHAEIGGFPATKVTEVRIMIDPTTARSRLSTVLLMNMKRKPMTPRPFRNAKWETMKVERAAGRVSSPPSLPLSHPGGSIMTIC